MICLSFWLVYYVEIIILLLSPKNVIVIDMVQSEVSLNQIGSLWRKMTTIDDRHVEI